MSYAKTLFHGKQSEVTHCLDGVFTGIDTPVKVARYHSLAVLRDDLPECLKVTAQTADGEIMAMRHKEYPVVGLQFHPESSPGPNDTGYLFDKFINLMEGGRL